MEVSVLALGGGSFRPQLRAKAKKLKSLLLSDFRQGIVAALAAVLVSRVVGDAEPNINIKIDHVEMIYDTGDKIILPREAYTDFKKIKNDQDIDASLRNSFEVLE